MAFSQFEHPKIDWEALDLYQEFERFRHHVTFVFGGPFSDLLAKQQAGWLGTWIGEQGREIYKTLAWTDGEKEDSCKVLDKFANYIRPRKNKRIARHLFKLRKQGPSFDHFVKDLRFILMDCEDADSDDMLIDAIIAGVREKRVQERLLDRGEDLTLAEAKEIPQQLEMSQKQIKIFKEELWQVLTVSAKTKYPAPKNKSISTGDIQIPFIKNKHLPTIKQKVAQAVGRIPSTSGIWESAQLKAQCARTITNPTTG